MKRCYSYATIAFLGAFVFANAYAGGPTEDTVYVDYGSTDVSYLNPSGAAIGDPLNGLDFDPFNAQSEDDFENDWFKTNYAMDDLVYGDGTVVSWEHGGSLPAGYGAITAFDNEVTGHLGFATELALVDNNERYTTYYRMPMRVSGATSGPFLMDYVFDDGAALYLNGDPWLRVNCCIDAGTNEVIGSDPPWFTAESIATGPEDDIRTIELPNLPNGNNHTLAISLHNASNTSSDTGIDFRIYKPGNYRPWSENSSGNWANAANWEFDVAGSGEFAMFGTALTGRRTIYTDSNVTLDGIQFDSTGSVNIAGPGALNLAGRSGQDASLNVFAGTPQFQVAVNLNKNLDAEIVAGSSIDFNNELSLNNRTLTKIGDGDLIVGNNENAGDGVIDVQAGALAGGGTVAGDVRVNGGTIAPAGIVDSLGSSSVLTINGDASVNTGSIVLNVYAAGVGDAISGGGAGTFTIADAATIQINQLYTPSEGDSFEILPGWGGINGNVSIAGGSWAFDATTGTATFGMVPPDLMCDLNADGSCDIADINMLIDQAGVTVAEIDAWLAEAGPENGLSGPYLAGDANLDGSVDAQDLNQVGQNWLSDGTTWESGDFNGDNATNAQDLNTIGQAWLATVDPARAAVPEPSSLSLLLFAVLGLGLRRRS